MDRTLFHEIWTVVLLIVFIGIWAWAWSRKRKRNFDRASRLPLEEDNGTVNPPKSGDKS